MADKVDLQALLNNSLSGATSPMIPTVADIDPLNMDGDELMASINASGSSPKMPQVSGETQPGASDNPYTDFMQSQMANFKATSPGESLNPIAAGKQELFGAGADNHFYERYYQHPKFDKLGFSPFRDNETFYNENSTAWDDFRRTSGEWAALGWLGLKDAASFGTQSDPQMAKDFERYMAIGSSTRGGGTQFFNNLFLNSGYTFGIMAELAVEEFALAFATGASLGTAAPATGAAMAARGTRAFMKIKKGFELSRKLMKRIDNLQDVSKARKFFNSSVNSLGRFANPLSSTTEFIKNVNKLDNVGGFAKTTLGLASAYRDIRNVRLAFGESALEGGMVQNDLSKELLQQHYSKHGRPPTDEEALEIKQTAVAAGSSAAWQNLPAIFYSNKLVFDNLFKTFNPIRSLTSNVVMDNAAGKILFRKSADQAFEAIGKGFKGMLKSAKNPGAYARKGMNYFKANFGEGGQEIIQEVIAGATKDYYMNEGSEASIFTGGYYASLATNMHKMNSVEGLEIFGSGFFMGGLVGSAQRGIGAGKDLFSKIRNPEQHTALKAEREKYLNDTVNKLNQFYDDPKKYLSPELENMTNQSEYAKGMMEAMAKGDTKTFEDLKSAAGYDHAWTALEMGRFDTMIERLESEKDLTAEDRNNMSPEEYDKYTQSVDTAIDRAHSIRRRYDMVQKKYSNPINPNQAPYGSDERKALESDSNAWVKAQKSLVFFQQSFDHTLEQMNDILNTAKEDTGLKNMPMSEFNLLFTMADTQGEIQQLKKELESMGTEQTGISQETRKQRKDREKKLDLLEKYQDAMQEYHSIGEDTKLDDAQVSTRSMSGEKLETSKDERKAVENVYSAYQDYLKFMGQQHKDYVFNDNVMTSFQKILDFQQLESVSHKMTEAVNTLTNPGEFMRQAQRMSEVNNYKMANRKEEIRKMLTAYVDAMLKNKMMQELHDAGMFFDPDDLVALEEHDVIPKNFFYTNNTEVAQNSSDYVKARGIVKKWYDVMDKEIPEHDTGNMPFDTFARHKINEDNRKYKDYAEQFGFDPEAASSVVSSAKVLQSIIDSPYATKREVALAKELLKNVGSGEVITFVNDLGNPGKYDASGKISIDARYNSREYKIGTTPIEHVILHEMIHKVTVDKLKTDDVFNDEITALREKALSTYQTKNTADVIGGRPAKPYYGLKDNAEFIAEALSNHSFQLFLGGIEHKSTGTHNNMWADFIDSIGKMLQRWFGKGYNNTVLNATIELVTSNIGFARPTMTLSDYNSGVAKIETDRNAEIKKFSNEYLENATGAPEIELVTHTVKENADGKFEVVTDKGQIISTHDEKGLATEAANALDVTEVKTEVAEGKRLYKQAPLVGETWKSPDHTYEIQDIHNEWENEAEDGKVTAIKDGAEKLAKITKQDWIQGVEEGVIKKVEPEEGGAKAIDKVDIKEAQIQIGLAKGQAEINAKYDQKLINLKEQFRQEQEEGKAKAEAAAAGKITPITKNTPLDEMYSREPRLVDKLVDAFRTVVANEIKIGNSNMLPGIEEMEDLELMNSDTFKKWLTGSASTPTNIINAYQGNRVTEPVITTSGTEIKSQSQKKILIDELGYDEGDWTRLKLDQIKQIIAHNVTKAQFEAEGLIALASDAAGDLGAGDQLIADVKETIANEVANARTMEEFAEAKGFAHAQLAEHAVRGDTQLTKAWVKDILLQKKKDMAFSFTAEDMTEDSTVVMANNWNKMVLTNDPTSDFITFVNTDGTKAVHIHKSQVQQKVKYVYHPMMDDPAIVELMVPKKVEQMEIKFSAEDMETQKNETMKGTEAEDEKIGENKGKSKETLAELKAQAKKNLKNNCK